MLSKILAVTLLALAISSPARTAAGGCHEISGTYVNRNVECTVPALACVESVVTGDHAGTSMTIITAFDLATQTFSGTVTNFLDTGAVITSTIVGTLIGGVGDSVTTITGGTRQFAHATGGSVTHSVNGVGAYTGQYCLGIGANRK